MNESKLEQNYLELKEDLSIIVETAAKKNYCLNYPKIDYEAIPEIEIYPSIEQILEDFEPYLRNRSIIMAPPSAPPEDLLGVIYTAYETNHLDRRLAEAMIASKMIYIPDIMKLQIKEGVICEASLLEIAEKCYEQRQENIIYRRNFIESCQQFIQIEPCVRAQSQMKSLGIPFHKASLGVEEEDKTCLRLDSLEVLDKELEVDPFKNTWVSNPFSTEIVPKQETFTIEFSSAVLQKLNCLLPKHKKKSIINTDYSCVNFQSYLRDCLASQEIATEYDHNKSLLKKFDVAKIKYIFNLVEIAEKISFAQRAKYSNSSANQKYSISDLKKDLQKYYTEFKQACLYNEECHLSGPSLVEDFCKKALSEKSFVHTDDFISFLEQIKQVSITCDPQDIRLYVVDNQPYLYGKRKSVQKAVQIQSPLSINPVPETEVDEIDFILPAIPENDEIDRKNVKQYINVAGQGVLCQQVKHRSAKHSNTNDAYDIYLEKKVIDNLNNTYHKAEQTEEIAKLDEKIMQEIDTLNIRLQTALTHKYYSASDFHELEELFNSIKSNLNTQHELIKKRASLVFPTYVERFKVACRLTKIDSYNQDLLKAAFIKTERFLDNVEIIYCHPARMTEIQCAVIWKAQQSGCFTKELANLLLSIRYENLLDRYKYLLDSDGVIRKASFLESAERVYQAFSLSKIDSNREQFEENYDQFKKLDCHQDDNDLLFVLDRLHHLRTESPFSEQEVLQVNTKSENLVLQDSSSQEESFPVPFEQDTKNKFVCFNEIELGFFNELLKECQETNNSRLRYTWQISLRELMKEIASIPRKKNYESDELVFGFSSDKDLEDKCYSTIANIIYRAKTSLDHLFQGKSISFGSYIDHGNPDSINNAFNEVIKEYEENNKQTMKCHLYGDELIDQFRVVTLRKIQQCSQQAEEEQKQVYEKENSKLNIFQLNKKADLKNIKKLKIKKIQVESQIKQACILKIGELAKQHGPENIFLYLNPLLNTSIELYEEDLPKEKLGYFIRQQKVGPVEESSKIIKKDLTFNSNRGKRDECKFLEKKCDRLSGCSFWEAPFPVSKEDDSLVEKSFETSRLRVPMSKYSCSSR